MNVSPSERPDRSIRSCLRCGAEQVVATMGGVRVLIEPRRTKRFSHRSRVDPLVCPKCGHVEWVVRKPDLFESQDEPPTSTESSKP